MLAKEGLAGEAIDRVLDRVYQVMVEELRRRNEPAEFIANELQLLCDRVEEERATPGVWTT